MTERSRKLACIHCRRCKRKCTGNIPCHRCEQHNLRCIFEETKVSRDGQFNRDLLQRVERLEGLYSRITTLEKTIDTRLSNETLSEKTGTTNSHYQETNTGGAQSSVGAQLPLEYRNIASPQSYTSSEDFLPPRKLLLEILDIYFDQIHPWIPILHVSSFMDMVNSTNDAPIIVLQAIVSVTVKFLTIPRNEQKFYSCECRKAVLLSAIDRFSIESLQASLIIAFETIGCGKGPRSWSIVSSATRIVEQLGLTYEEDDIDRSHLLNRIGFLRPSKSAAEAESRRRIFWAAYLLDQFCSTTTGWNSSMMKSEIRRRLPMEGLNFAHNDDKKTRYLEISEDFLGPENREQNDHNLGGYSYLIEATECLSRVVSFLMRETISPGTTGDMNSWLSKFMSLNSMLVRWKANLPEKWKSLKPTARGLDENLALAHVSHDTSVLLLHHNLAYPPTELLLLGKWTQSVQTCISTATEIAVITEQFLQRVKIVVAPQFCFCVFIAGRTLLANQLHGNSSEEIRATFESIVQSLKKMAKRWEANGFEKDNLASRFAKRLEAASNSESEIDARETVFSGYEELYNGNASLSSPPVADIIRDMTNGVKSNADSLNIGDLQSSEFDYVKELSNIRDLDYIFSWDYEP